MAGSLIPSGVGIETIGVPGLAFTVSGSTAAALFEGLGTGHTTTTEIYMNSSSHYFELIINEPCNIWSLPNKTYYKHYVSQLNVYKEVNGVYELTNILQNSYLAGAPDVWVKLFLNVQPGKYKFMLPNPLTIGQSGWMAQEWFLERTLKKYLVKNNASLFKYSNNTWEDIGLTEPLLDSDWENNGMIEISTIPAAAWQVFTGNFEIIVKADIKPSQVVVNHTATGICDTLYDLPQPLTLISYLTPKNTLEEVLPLEIGLQGTPISQLVKANGDINIKSIYAIDQIIITSTQPSFTKVLISFNSGILWKAYKNNTWITVNINNLNSVITNANNVTEINSIPGEAWQTLRESSDTLRFAYLLPNETEIDKLVASIDMRGRWDRAVLGTDFIYGYRKYNNAANLEVELYTNGDFKINYC